MTATSTSDNTATMGDVPLAMQVKLLRLIESGTYRPVGAVDTLQADFRLVAATHKPLAEMVADGRFRQDLAAWRGPRSLPT